MKINFRLSDSLMSMVYSLVVGETFFLYILSLKTGGLEVDLIYYMLWAVFISLLLFVLQEVIIHRWNVNRLRNINLQFLNEKEEELRSAQYFVIGLNAQEDSTAVMFQGFSGVVYANDISKVVRVNTPKISRYVSCFAMFPSARVLGFKNGAVDCDWGNELLLVYDSETRYVSSRALKCHLN